MTIINTETIQKAFANVSTKVPKHLLNDCVTLANKLSINDIDILTDEWEVYSMKHGGTITHMNKEIFHSFLNSPGMVQLLQQQSIKNENNDTSSSSSSSNNLVSSSSAVKIKQERNAAALLSTVTPSPKKRLRLLEEAENAESAKKKLSNNDDNASASATAISSSSSTNDDNKKENNNASLATTPNTFGSSSSSTFMNSLLKVRPSASNGTKFVDRKGSGTVVASYKQLSMANVVVDGTATQGQRVVDINQKDYISINVQKQYRYGFVPIETKANALDEHILDLQESMIEHLNLDEELIESIGVPCQENVICFGRICTDAHEGKINSNSILLEGSRHASCGKRVQLDLSKLKSNNSSSNNEEGYSLFPGQIVAVEGINPSGRKMIASKIYDGVSLPKKTTKLNNILLNSSSNTTNNDGPVRIVVASGPFTTSDNLEYEPFRELISNLLSRDDKPHVVILTGPFVDLLHPKVATGDITLPLEDGTSMPVPPEVLFINRIVTMIETLYEEYNNGMVGEEKQLHTQFILQPSIDDVLSNQVYPQPPFVNDRYNSHIMMGGTTSSSISKTSNTSTKPKVLDGYEIGTLGLNDIENAGRHDDNGDATTIHGGGSSSRRRGGGSRHNQRVHLISNPCTLQINNEIVIGITSTDILQHLCRDETNYNLKEKRLLKLSKHLLQQQCYYPLFPSNANVPIDYTHRTQTLMNCTPDILIIPSQLNPFVNVVSHCDSSSSSDNKNNNNEGSNNNKECLVLNPGWLTKGTTGGTFANIDVYPIKTKTLIEKTRSSTKTSATDADADAVTKEQNEKDHDTTGTTITSSTSNLNDEETEVEHYVHERSEINIIKI